MITKEVTTDLGTEFIVIEKEDGSTTWIPKIEENADYQAYLASLEEVKNK